MAKQHDTKNISLHSIISSIQKVALYETKSRFYVIGTNNTETRFRVLKIDRMEPKELDVHDDQREYTQDEIIDLVNMIDMGNRAHSNPRSSTIGVAKVVSAFGIVGFVKFLEGYYMILVTKRRRIAVIGHHTIYKIEDTTMIYIPHDSIRIFHPDEQRYVRMFQNIDLKSNFYFSYSYDLTHTLQQNMALPECLRPNISKSHLSADSEKTSPRTLYMDYGVRTQPYQKFVWNSYLLSEVENVVHRDWLLYVIHGFIGQSNISVFGRSIYVIIIARRSNKYAGTRFLKRGANFDGDVANEVETEQIVHDSCVSSLNNGRFSSFVQLRGSVPGHWSQDLSKIVPKPTITSDLPDPFVETAGKHFNQLLKKYGSPIIILNLVKKREKKKHESTLSEELSSAVKYLNQFLPLEHQISYISFDMARKNKGKESNVMGRLANIANNAILKTGIFQSQNTYYNQKQLFKQFNTFRKWQNSDSTMTSLDESAKGSSQMGIIRTNCVDCLDRTNTAQFAIGKCALGYQLCALGVLDKPKLEFDSDCVRILEELYEDHGDTLALQYGGSQLVHRIKTYRKTAPWTSQGNDIMQTLSRYFSNTFSDQEKQQTMNVFLGLFLPEENGPAIWELLTDYYLHHKPVCKYSRKTNVLTQWWGEKVFSSLPRAFDEFTKDCSEMIQIQREEEDMIDIYHDYYRPYEFSPLSEVFAYQISHSVRDFMPHFTTNFSPFAVRIRPGKRREESGSKNLNMKNPSLTGQSSTGSTASSESSSIETSSDDDESHHTMNNSQSSIPKSQSDTVYFGDFFPSMKEYYGTQLEYPKRDDYKVYKRFVLVDRNATHTMEHSKVRTEFMQQVSATNVVEFQFRIPMVDLDSYEFYAQYVEN